MSRLNNTRGIRFKEKKKKALELCFKGNYIPEILNVRAINCFKESYSDEATTIFVIFNMGIFV